MLLLLSLYFLLLLMLLMRPPPPPLLPISYIPLPCDHCNIQYNILVNSLRHGTLQTSGVDLSVGMTNGGEDSLAEGRPGCRVSASL